MPTRTISASIRLDGERQFNKAMEDVNRGIRAMSAEVKASESAFLTQGRTMETLRNHQRNLQAVYDQTREKVRILQQQLEDLSENQMENSKEADHVRASLGTATASMNRYDAAIRDVAREIEELNRSEGDAADGMHELSDSTQDAARQMGVMDVALGNMLANLGQRGVSLLKEIGQIGIEYNAQIESYTMAMTTALGSAEAAASAIANIKLDAAVTPYSVDALVRANQLLIAAGDSADGARETVMALSDAISATGGGNDELQRMAQNLQQIQNVGKASAMDIKQFQMAGIDVYGILADYTGLAIEDATELTVTYDLLSSALKNAASEGGRYFGANAAQAATLNGQISTLKDNVQSKLGEAFKGASKVFSEELLPAANEFVAGIDIEKALEQFDDLLAVATAVGGTIAAIKVAKTVGAWATAANEAIAAFGQAAISVTTMEAGLDLMNSKLTVSQMIYGVLTGQISAATVGQLALNAATAAFPAAVFVAGVTAVALAAKSAYEESKRMREQFTEKYESGPLASSDIKEVTAALDEMIARRKELEEIGKSGGNGQGNWLKNLTVEQAQELHALDTAITNVTGHLEELQAKEAAQQAYRESTQGKIDMTSASLKELQDAYDKAYQSAYESLTGQFDLFDQVQPVVAGSTEDMIKALESQAAYYTSYADNLDVLRGLTVEGIGLNAELVSSLTDGSEKSVIAAATIAQGYEEALAQGDEAAAAYIENLNAAFDAQREAAQRAAKAMVQDQQAQIQELEGQLDELTEQLNKENEAQNSAEKTMEGFVRGLEGKSGSINEAMFRAGSDALAAYQGGLNSGDLSLPAIKTPNGSIPIGSIPSHAAGLDYVPYDGYLSQTHKGEMIVPAAAAEAIRQGRVGAKTEINIYTQEVSPSTMDYMYAAFVERAGDDI